MECMQVSKQARPTTSRTAAIAALSLIMTLMAACAGAPPPNSAVTRAPADDCEAAALDAADRRVPHTVEWLIHSDAADRDELDEWCRGVGAPVVAGSGAAPVHADSVAVITWNIHMGAARIDAFVGDLLSGALTGEPMRHFVLLVQEARRNGGTVPAVLPSDARSARRLGQLDVLPDGDIVAIAQRLGLRLFYVPSMRNGNDRPAEDRGNAILSTLPLTDLTAIELPLLAQRRVAVAATIPLIDAAGHPRSLRVSSVHLDYGANRSRLLAPFGSGRMLQATALADALGQGGNTVVGGDFNTWSLDRLEGALTVMQEDFPHFSAGPAEPTHYTAGIWPRRLDHLFLRAADVAGSAPSRIADRYGSDHYPLLAWIHM
jgi:endonuclease/exonuclease/phosphatase family metal-dependent hydrolase